jgi:hypothetical protein
MNKKNYSILSVKILKAGVQISYYDMKTDRNINIEDKKNSPHPDLVNAIIGFDEYLARVHLLPQEKYSNITSTGFAIKSDSIVVLKGMLTAPSEKKLAINSDAIDLSKDSYGFEDDLQTVVDIVISEAGKYLFEGKMIKQAKLDFEDGQEKENQDKEDIKEENPDLEKVDIPDDVKDEVQEEKEEMKEEVSQDKPSEDNRQYADQEPGTEEPPPGDPLE